MRSRALSVALLAAVVAGCGSFTDVSRELAIQVTADKPTVPAGEGVRITYNATGAFLTRVVIDFGDSSDQEFINIDGAQSANGNVLHTYDEAGTYTVTAIAIEAVGAREEAELTIQVSESND
jgi:PKD repeat protein